MLALKVVSMSGSITLFAAAFILLAYDYSAKKSRHNPEPVRWRTTIAMVALAWAPLLMALCIAGAMCR